MNHRNAASDAETDCQQAILLLQSGRAAEALALCNRGIGKNMQHAGAHFYRGMALEGLGRLDEALASYDFAIKLQPGAPIGHYHRGNVLFRLQRFEDALAAYQQAIAIKPDFAEVHVNRGLLFALLQRFDDALASYGRAVAARPDFAEAHINRGFLLAQLGRHHEALADYDRALALRPDFVEAHNNRGVVLTELKQYRDALSSYDLAIAIRPDHAEAHNNRAILLAELGRFDDALSAYDVAIAVKPDYAEAYDNRGVLLKELGRFDEAFASYDQALALQPQRADACFNKAELLLLTGDFILGWELYEKRWQSRFRAPRPGLGDIPLWTGQRSLAGKTLLIEPEAGYGDLIMFVRYSRLLRRLGANVVIQTPSCLLSLFACLGDRITAVDEGSALPRLDFRCPIMSLPRALGTTMATIPAGVPYLRVMPEKRRQWRDRLGPAQQWRIGLMWSGKADRNVERSALTKRSIPLQLLQPLLDLPFEFHSLQKDIAPADLGALQTLPNVRTHHDELQDFADTAALIQEMDLVISIDTSVAHLAGALGKELWVLLPYSVDYRWLPEGETTPWYPTATLFRQVDPGQWHGVIEAVHNRLLEYGAEPAATVAMAGGGR